MKGRGRLRAILTDIVAPLSVFAVMLALFLGGISDARKSSDKEGRRIALESIRRAAVCCYAVEGSYPASYEYLRTNYGVRVDEVRYAVVYEVFASNVMPEITVIER